MPKRRGLHEAGAEDGGDAEDDEGADVHGALPHLLIDICRYVSRRKVARQAGSLRHREVRWLCLAHLHRQGVGIRRGGVLSLSKRD